MADYTIDRIEEPAESAAPVAGRGRRAIVIAGMHRSGTSAFARLIGLLGAAPPAHLAEASPDGEAGLWEPLPIRQLHDELLATAGSLWDDVAVAPPSWFASDAAAAYIERAAALLEDEYGEGRLIVLKDPRICRLLPFWQRVFARAGVAPAYVLPIRNPLEVAASLRSRDGFSGSKSLLLWLEHVIEAELWTRGAPRCVLQYEDLLRDWEAVAGRIAEELDLTWPQTGRRARAEIDRCLAPELRHHTFSDYELAARSDIAGWVKRVYGAMLSLASGGADESDVCDSLDQVAAELRDADAAYGPVIAELELDIERVRVAERDLRGLLEARAAEVSELEAARDDLREQMAAHTAELRAVELERHSLRTQLEQRAIAVTSLEKAREDLGEQLEAAAVEARRQNDELDARVAAHAETLRELDRLQILVRAKDADLAVVGLEASRLREELGAARAACEVYAEQLKRALDRLQEQAALLSRGPLYLIWAAVVPAGVRLRLRHASQLGSWLVRPTPARFGWIRAFISLRRSGAFDYEFYAERYPDVTRARLNPLMHYIEHGAREGRDPSARFSTAAYLARHPDLDPRRRNPLWDAHRRGEVGPAPSEPPQGDG